MRNNYKLQCINCKKCLYLQNKSNLDINDLIILINKWKQKKRIKNLNLIVTLVSFIPIIIMILFMWKNGF